MREVKERKKMAKIGELIRHNQGVTASVTVVIILLGWAFGCESKVGSMMDPDRQVTRAELALEVKQLSMDPAQDPNDVLARAEIKFALLDKDAKIRQQIFDFAALSAASGGVDPAGVVALLFSIIGVGAVIDNRIKDKVIKNRPAKEPT